MSSSPESCRELREAGGGEEENGWCRWAEDVAAVLPREAASSLLGAAVFQLILGWAAVTTATAAAACAPRHIRTSIPPYAIHAIRTPRPVLLTQHSRRRLAYGAFALCSCYVVLLLLLATSLHSLQPCSCSLLTAEQFVNKYKCKAQAYTRCTRYKYVAWPRGHTSKCKCYSYSDNANIYSQKIYVELRGCWPAKYTCTCSCPCSSAV